MEPGKQHPQVQRCVADTARAPTASYPDAVREGIARALAVPEARFAWAQLLKMYVNEDQPRTKSGLALALANVADEEIMDHVIGLIRDPRHGESRIFMLRALLRSRKQTARDALDDAEADPVLGREASTLLKRLHPLRE